MIHLTFVRDTTMRRFPTAVVTDRLEVAWVMMTDFGFIAEANKPGAWVTDNTKPWLAVVGHPDPGFIYLLDDSGESSGSASWRTPHCYHRTREEAELALMRWALKDGPPII